MTPLATRLLYGIGGAVYAVKEAAYTMFILLYYTQVLGLNGTTTGVIIALSLLWDAISDPLVGVWSDRLTSRYGRRYPFMVASILPMGLGFLGLFWPPDSITESSAGLGAWLLFWSLWVRTCITLFCIPHLALSTDISRDYHERSQILGTRLSALFLFSVLIPAIALALIFTSTGSEDGRFVRSNYWDYAVFSCLVCWFVATLSSFGTRRYARPSTAESVSSPVTGPDSPPRVVSSLFRDLLRTLDNASFRYLFCFDVAMMVAYGVVAALNMLVWTFYWEFSPRQISVLLSLPSLLAVALVMATLPTLGRRFEKFQLLQLATVGMLINCLWLYPLHMTGLLPADNASLLFTLNFLTMLLFMYCFLMRTIQTQSIVADITDEHDWKHGLRQEGSFFAAINFSSKLATVAGPLYAGVALDVVGLRSGMLPGEVPRSVLRELVVAFGIGVIPAMTIALLFALRITLSKARVEDLQRRLWERNLQCNLQDRHE